PARDMVKEARIWKDLEAVAPEALATFKEATAAFDRNDLQRAAGLYRAVLEKAPIFTPALRRAGGALVILGREGEGMGMLERAVALDRSPENLGALARHLAFSRGKGEPTDGELERALRLAEEALAGMPGDLRLLMVKAQAYIHLDRRKGLRHVSEELLKEHPGRMESHWIAAIRAAADADWSVADFEIRRAGELGLPDEQVTSFRNQVRHAREGPNPWRLAAYPLAISVLWLAGWALLFVVGKRLSRATLRSIEGSDANPAETPRRLRSRYRGLIVVAAAYYYLSLPVVALLVVALTASIIYACFLAGSIPVKLVFFLVIGALVTLFAILRSLFVRIRDEDPGLPLPEKRAPELWRLVREVAQRVGTSPVDEVWLTPGTEVAVFERSPSQGLIGRRRRRALILGLAVLDHFPRNAYRAVLAHEYGHLSNRDTAGGEVALRVQARMLRFAQALHEAGQAVTWNLGFQFLRLYQVFFRRITFGATRLQEVLADRVAVAAYGAVAFREGLTHVIRRDVEFSFLATKAIERAVDLRTPLANLYELPPPSEPEERVVASKVEALLDRPTSDDDTHPSPGARFRLADRLRGGDVVPDPGTITDLLPDRAMLAEKFTRTVATRVAVG
ncbi:MAG: M48 family metalloprotease, partial [Planctomycetes bacterium]|nr:M48 family metalloprotease [Planctomycetota bacterium]